MVNKFLNKSPLLAVDIGGNVGEYSAEIRRRNPQTEIHIFEPSSANIEKLKKRFWRDEAITIISSAVSDNTGSATLYSDESGSGLGSLTQRRLDHFNIDFNIEETINIIRFEDYWMNNLGGRHIDIIKIDIEGHELDALRGMGKAIYSAHVIQFEFGGCNIDTRTYFQDFWYFFKAHNFNVYRITPLGLEWIEKYRESDEFFFDHKLYCGESG